MNRYYLINDYVVGEEMTRREFMEEALEANLFCFLQAGKDIDEPGYKMYFYDEHGTVAYETWLSKEVFEQIYE